jgi:hypothetical protein
MQRYFEVAKYLWDTTPEAVQVCIVVLVLIYLAFVWDMLTRLQEKPYERKNT